MGSYKNGLYIFLNWLTYKFSWYPCSTWRTNFYHHTREKYTYPVL